MSTSPFTPENQVNLHNSKHNFCDPFNTQNNNSNNYHTLCNEKNSEMQFNEYKEIKISEKSKPTLLDEILDNYGYKFQIIKVIVLSVLLYYLSSYMIYHLSCYLLIVKREFHISDDLLTVLACLGFGFKALGCFLTGQMTKIFARKSLLSLSILILLLLNIFLAFFFKLWVYFIFLIVGCFIAGILDPLNIDVLCESLPITFRGFFLCFTYTGFPLNICIQYFLITNYSEGDVTDINLVLHINTAIIILIFILIFGFFRDSARHQLIKENYKEAYEILNNLTEAPLTDEAKELIKKQSCKGNRIIHEESLKNIFSPVYIRTTILFIFLNFSYNCMTDGVSYILNLILLDSIPDSDEKKISYDGMILYFYGMTSYLLCGIVTEISCLGRKFGLAFCSFLVCLFSVLFILNPQNYFPWITLLILSTNSTTSLSISFVSESYPTKIRDVSQGFMNSIANTGSLVGQFVFIILYKISKTKTTFIYMIMNSLVCIVLVFFIKNEMYRKPLDNIYEGVQSETDEEKKSNS